MTAEFVNNFDLRIYTRVQRQQIQSICLGEKMKKLYIGNISWQAKEEDLQELFSQYGQVESVRIITDRETGRSRGFGFVEMENAERAMAELNGADLHGRSLRVSEARERRRF
jgi:RNA recognition motif-containing protein